MYGPYIKYGGYNFRLPKGWKDATDLTLNDCIAIVDKKNGGASVETKQASSKEKTEKKPSAKKTVSPAKLGKKAPVKKEKK